MKFSFGRLLGLFILVPFVELYILFKLAEITSPFMTLSIIIITGMLGAYFARQQGRIVLSDINRQVGNGEMPADGLINGLCVLIGGILLLTPGVLTDILGFSLILPITRIVTVKFIKRHYRQLIKGGNVHIHTNMNVNNETFNHSDLDEDIVIIDEDPKDQLK